MLLELAEVKNYLRVDTDEEDGLVTRLSQSAETLCMDVARIADAEEFAALGDTAKTAVLYATAYLYEHREEADHQGKPGRRWNGRTMPNSRRKGLP